MSENDEYGKKLQKKMNRCFSNTQATYLQDMYLDLVSDLKYINAYHVLTGSLDRLSVIMWYTICSNLTHGNFPKGKT